MTEELRLCFTCGRVIPYNRNGNSKNCSKECYDQNKAKLAKVAGQQIAMERVLLINEEIVAGLYQTYGSNSFSAKLMLDMDFNWAIYSREVTVNGLVAKKLIAHGYTLFTNHNVQLWKL